MARPSRPRLSTPNSEIVQAGALTPEKIEMAVAQATSIFKPGRPSNPETDRNQIARRWQIEAYRHVNICGEARYAASLFANMAARAEIGVSLPNALVRKAVWVESGTEVEAFNELAPTVRDRSKLIRDYMTHYIIAGECYLIARDRVDTDPEFEDKRGEPIWEIVAVTELQKVGETWRVRHDNGNWLNLSKGDPVIRLWNPDPADRREAWSPYRSLLPTLCEIEFLTKHIFTQVRSRLMSAGVWFLPDNLTFPAPPVDSVEGGAEAIAAMNEAEQFMISLAASSMGFLDSDEVAFPTVIMADPAAIEAIDQKKLIQFWSEIDDKAMVLRSDAVRRFALGMDLPPEQVLGSSGIAVTGAGGSAGSVNHWGVWANEEQSISAHIEPALDNFCGALTSSFLRAAVEGTDKVIAYDTASLRLRQDRSKEAVELYDRGLLKATVTLREVGFDPASDMMDAEEHKTWLLNRIVSGQATPEQIQAALILLGVELKVQPLPESGGAKEIPGRNATRNLDQHPVQGPPQGDHDHKDAVYSARVASAEVLVLRALEKAGNRLLNDGKRGRDKDRSTPAHMAHVVAGLALGPSPDDFDFGLANVVFSGMAAREIEQTVRAMGEFCAGLYETGTAYTREALIKALEGL